MNQYNSFFGVEAPKFILNDVEYLLDYWVTLKDEPQSMILQQESIITKHREWINLGDHWIFKGELYLWKYTSTEAKQLYQNLQACVNQNVVLYRRRDGQAFKDENDTAIKFRLDSIEHSYIKQGRFRDSIILTFISSDVVSLKIPMKNQMFYFDLFGSVGPYFNLDPVLINNDVEYSLGPIYTVQENLLYLDVDYLIT